eukprot:GHVT01054646.1.p1 GENE.GHVT01054646.1~~GHVT01054646.1.p1  ORF type:complete len:208 (-),score=1.50 GHVT01054646.1:200-823(-)
MENLPQDSDCFIMISKRRDAAICQKKGGNSVVLPFLCHWVTVLRLLIVVSDTSWRKIVATSLDSQLFLEVLEAVCDIPKFLGKSAPEHYSYLADDLSSAFGSNDAAALKSTVTFEPTADSGVTCVSQMKQDVTCTCPCDDLPHVVTALQILMSSPCTKSLMLFLSPSERNRVRTMPNRLMALSDCFIEETPQKTSVEFSRKTLASLM